MAVLGLFSAVFRTTVLKVQDARPELSPLRHVDVSDEGRCSFLAIELSKDGKGMFDKAFNTPWSHAVVHFEVKMSRF